MTVAFNGKDCFVQIYIDGTTPGIKPDGDTYTWDADSNTIAIATSASVNTSKKLTSHYGLNHDTPQIIKQGNISYEFNLESVYTTDKYGSKDLQELIDSGTQFAMKLTANDPSGTEAMSIELEYCACASDNMEVSDDGDLTCSLSGQCVSKTINVLT